MGSEANHGCKGKHVGAIPAIIIQTEGHVIKPSLDYGTSPGGWKNGSNTLSVSFSHVFSSGLWIGYQCMHAIFIYSWLIFGMIHDTCLVSVGQSFF